jgi:hypothetical protein
MNLLNLVDLGDGTERIVWSCEHENRTYSHPIKFYDPLSKSNRKDLRWYLK